VDHGPADKGPPHQHEVVQNADGSWFLAQAGAEDEEDPNHTHEISFEKEELTRAGRLLKQYRQDWQK
jgi:hypothetical protein